MRPKDIGTRAETAVVRYARTAGFPHADRLTLTGSLDRGDVGLCPGIVLEVKGGDYARAASDLLIEKWLDETYREREHAGAAAAFLVVQRTGVGAANAGRWWTFWRLGWIAELAGQPWALSPHMPVRCHLHESLTMLRAAGYGHPLIDRV